MDERSCMCCCNVIYKCVVIEVLEVSVSVSCFKRYNGILVKPCHHGLLDIIEYVAINSCFSVFRNVAGYSSVV